MGGVDGRLELRGVDAVDPAGAQFTQADTHQSIERTLTLVGAAGRRSSARDELQSNAFTQKIRVIVDVHRERARSYTSD
ncbi:hypothetical protein D3C86_1894400 [compost metagenome]